MMTRRQFLPALIPAAALPAVAIAATRPTAAPLPANVPTIDSPDQLARLAAAYALAYDRAAAVDWHDPAGDENEEEAILDAFDAAEDALFQAMEERETPAFVADGRTFINMQCDPDYIPDRPQTVMIMPRDGAAPAPSPLPEWFSEGSKLASEWDRSRSLYGPTFKRPGVEPTDDELDVIVDAYSKADDRMIEFVLKVTECALPLGFPHNDALDLDDWNGGAVVIGGNLWSVVQSPGQDAARPMLVRVPLGSIISEGGAF
jgi:hypothetical protein